MCRERHLFDFYMMVSSPSGLQLPPLPSSFLIFGVCEQLLFVRFFSF